MEVLQSALAVVTAPVLPLLQQAIVGSRGLQTVRPTIEVGPDHIALALVRESAP